jgi:hypothetical protein
VGVFNLCAVLFAIEICRAPKILNDEVTQTDLVYLPRIANFATFRKPRYNSKARSAPRKTTDCEQNNPVTELRACEGEIKRPEPQNDRREFGKKIEIGTESNRRHG